MLVIQICAGFRRLLNDVIVGGLVVPHIVVLVHVVASSNFHVTDVQVVTDDDHQTEEETERTVTGKKSKRLELNMEFGTFELLLLKYTCYLAGKLI
jgi:hypothetical protein